MGFELPIPNLPFGRTAFTYQIDVYRDQGDCEDDEPLATAIVGSSMSNVAVVEEDPNDNFARAIDDSGTYIIKITAEGSNCSVEYDLQPTNF